jgi:5-hydroxyisourate hydrolase
MSAITTHVLDTARGKPASGVAVTLERASGEAWQHVAQERTDRDGRAKLAPASDVVAGSYRLRFETGAYFRAQQIESFHPEVVVTFSVRDAAEHHHVPLLLAPYGYSTYRGS